MANKTELLARIAEIKKEMSQNGEQQSRVKQKYKGQLEALQKSKSKKEQEKNEAAKNKPVFMWTRAGKEYSARIADIDKEINDIQHQIDTIYSSDEEFLKLTSRYSVIYVECRDLEAQLREITFNEKLGENCVYIFPTGFAERDRIGVVIDGNDMGTVPSPIGIYPLSEGVHTLYVTRNYDTTESVQFRLNGNNKFIYYEFEYYGRGYNKNSSNTFDEFVKDNKLFSFSVDAIKDHILNF